MYWSSLVNGVKQRAALANDSRRVCATLYRKHRARMCIGAEQIHEGTITGGNTVMFCSMKRALSCQDENARELKRWNNYTAWRGSYLTP
jgi:hypothetical protein